jgi:hypothetical protein
VKTGTTRGDFEGLILPRSETSDDAHLVLKLGSGYNVGLRFDTILQMEETGYREAHYKIPEKEFPTDPVKPRVKLFGTGGTIASRLDYRTGAVIPAFSPGELYGSVPELADICNLDTEKLFGVLAVPRSGGAGGRGDSGRLGRRGDRPRYRHDAPHGGGALVHGAAAAGARRDGGLAAFLRQAVLRRGAEPHQRNVDSRARADCRGDGVHVRPHVGPL